MTGRLPSLEGDLAADVCVIGGGPAGSMVARRLAGWGHRVVLVDRATPRRPERIECLPPSVWGVLEILGLRERIASAGFLACAQTRLRWSDEGEVLRPHPGALIVDRARFDSVLLEAARVSGVTVLRPARARTPSWIGGDWRVPIEGAAWSGAVVARFLVDATGRAARRRAGMVRTVALSATWRGRAPRAVEMRVEAIAAGWCWGVTLPDGCFHTLAVVDMDSCAGLDRCGREAKLRDHLRAAALFRTCLSSTIRGRIGVCDASPYLADAPATSCAIKVGDAAVAFDPLSSQGVQSALRSAVQASAVVHTILAGGDTEAAIEFYRHAQHESFDHHRRVTAQLYAARHAEPATAFWQSRRATPASGPAAPAPSHTWSGRTGDPPLMLSPHARLRAVPTLVGSVVRRADALVHPALTRPVASLEGDTLAPLLARIRNGQHAADILTAWAPLVPAKRGRRILDWLQQHGVLVPFVA